MCLIKITHCLLNITEPSFFYHSFKRKKNWNSVGNVCAQTSQWLIPLLWWFINIPLNRSLPATILELNLNWGIYTNFSFIHSQYTGIGGAQHLLAIPNGHRKGLGWGSEEDPTEPLKSRVFMQWRWFHRNVEVQGLTSTVEVHWWRTSHIFPDHDGAWFGREPGGGSVPIYLLPLDISVVEVSGLQGASEENV